MKYLPNVLMLKMLLMGENVVLVNNVGEERLLKDLGLIEVDGGTEESIAF